MRIFPIYQSAFLSNNRLSKDSKYSKYLVLFVDDCYIVISFIKELPINIRWFTDAKEFNRFINNLKKHFKNYEERKQEYCYCEYPNSKEDIPF